MKLMCTSQILQHHDITYKKLHRLYEAHLQLRTPVFFAKRAP